VFSWFLIFLGSWFWVCC